MSFLLSSFSSSSMASVGVVWCLVAVIHTVFLALDPKTTSMIVNTVDATSTLQVILVPSRCTPSQTTLSHPYIVAISYICLVSIALLSILYSKGFCAVSCTPTSPSNAPPNPAPPMPDPVASSSGANDPSLPARSNVAAGGAPPPPPPGTSLVLDFSTVRTTSRQPDSLPHKAPAIWVP
ncbi:hypothetical protein B0H13DRAFT_2520689 [Mycena leptocephala]|nr:hypothetical protein B0H13DRAFT_2520689 [Mycena leptocephala]